MRASCFVREGDIRDLASLVSQMQALELAVAGSMDPGDPIVTKTVHSSDIPVKRGPDSPRISAT